MQIPMIVKWLSIVLGFILLSLILFIFLYELGELKDSNKEEVSLTIERYQAGNIEKNTCIPAA